VPPAGRFFCSCCGLKNQVFFKSIFMPICRAGRFWETYPQEIWNFFSEAMFLNFSNVHCHEPQSKADAFQKNIENDVSMFLFVLVF